MLERARRIGPGRRAVRVSGILFRAAARYLKALGMSIGRRPEVRAAARASQLRLLLESLGPSFVKLGQLLSVRPDLVPPATIDELESLQDRVPPFPVDQARRVIEEELGAGIEELFESFDDEPLAAGSVAQVHKARLPGGHAVAVKIRRPGAAAAIAVDLAVMLDVARLLRRFGRFRFIDPVAAVGEWAASLERELDFRVEGRHADRFRHIFRNDDLMFTPAIFWELSAERVLVMDFVEGRHLSEMDEVEKSGINGRALAEHGARVFLKEVLEDGFFHGDLHPANILVTPDGRICYIDFGIVGTLNEANKRGIARMALAMVEGRAGEALAAAREMGARLEPANAAAMERDLAETMDRYLGLTLGEIKIDNLGREMMGLLYKHKVTLPRDRVLLAKAMVTIEGAAKLLYPDFDIVSLAKPYLTELVARYYPPPVVAARYLREVVEGLGALRGLAERERHGGAVGLEAGTSRATLNLYLILSFIALSWSIWVSGQFFAYSPYLEPLLFRVSEPSASELSNHILSLTAGMAAAAGWSATLASGLAALRARRRL